MANKSSKNDKSETKSKPRQRRLPGTEDNAIQELEDKALEYADIRDQRMALSKEESPLKEELLALMKKYKKQTYTCNGIEITRVVEEESVKVKIAKQDKTEPLEESEESDAAGAVQ